jgi:hypothetical protein
MWVVNCAGCDGNPAVLLGNAIPDAEAFLVSRSPIKHSRNGMEGKQGLCHLGVFYTKRIFCSPSAEFSKQSFLSHPYSMFSLISLFG